jgi:hypothetical protein
MLAVFCSLSSHSRQEAKLNLQEHCSATAERVLWSITVSDLHCPGIEAGMHDSQFNALPDVTPIEQMCWSYLVFIIFSKWSAIYHSWFPNQQLETNYHKNQCLNIIEEEYRLARSLDHKNDALPSKLNGQM